LSDTLGGLRPEEEDADSNPTEASVISQPAGDNQAEELPDNFSIRWFNSQNSEELKGVALVIHGLNLHPERMKPIINNLMLSGIDVLGLSLRGHGDNYGHDDDVDGDSARLESFKNVSYPIWINEAYLAYLHVKERGLQNKKPVFLAAFSIGGLIGLDLFANHSDVQFDKMVLFAPAISLRPTIYLERALSPFPRLVIPSLADGSYLANKAGTPIAAYNALFEALNYFEESAGSKLNIPTLIFIDEQDEFIPLGGLKKLVEEKSLDQWELYIVQREEEIKAGIFHHHIIDEYSTGKAMWEKMMEAVSKHLLGTK